MALPIVLFSSSCTTFRPQEFVKNILKLSELPQPKLLSDSIEGYEWSFETKYYSATVHLCTTDKRTIGDKVFSEAVQAFIHFFDPNVPSSFELAKAWLPYLKHIEPDILILVCNTSRNSDAVARRVALEWCIQNSFELVELIPEQDSGDEDDDFPETTGMARIVQALHAHTWPNLEMKKSPTVQSSYLRHMMKEQKMLNKQLESLEHSESSLEPRLSDTSSHDNLCETSDIATLEASCRNPVPDKPPVTPAQACTSDLNKTEPSPSDLDDVLQFDNIDWRTVLEDDDRLDEDPPLSGNHLGVDEFEQLFMKLKFMKDKAENLPPDQRKKYAEKVAISFWKAIGGDEDEINGLGEGSD